MYKFTNGIVVFDKKTKDMYLNAGYKLAEKQITIDEVIEKNDDKTSDRTIKAEHNECSKKTTKNRKSN